MLVLLHQFLVAHPSLPANTPELIALAKAKRDINYASYGSGPAASRWRNAQAQGRHRPGARPLQGDIAAVPAVVAGEVQLRLPASPPPRRNSRRGKALAIGGQSRRRSFPRYDLRRARLPEVETHAWFGLFVPAGSPREAVNRIYRDTRKILDEPEFRQLIDKGYEVGSGPEAFAAYIAKDRRAAPARSRSRARKPSSRNDLPIPRAAPSAVARGASRFLHGIGGNRRHWDTQLAFFASRQPRRRLGRARLR